jgi:hypothetical protein
MTEISLDIEGERVELTGEELDDYLPFFPDYRPARIILALATVKRRFSKLDQITVQHFVVEPDFGGKGIGVPSRDGNDCPVQPANLGAETK